MQSFKLGHFSFNQKDLQKVDETEKLSVGFSGEYVKHFLFKIKTLVGRKWRGQNP